MLQTQLFSNNNLKLDTLALIMFKQITIDSNSTHLFQVRQASWLFYFNLYLLKRVDFDLLVER